MKYFNYTLLALSILMVGFNATQVDLESPFTKDSLVAIIAVLAALCVVTISLILLTSKMIEEKYYKLRQ